MDGLQDAGFQVKLAHPFGLQVIKKAKVKTDNRDAFHLARLLRLDALPESYIYPKEKRPIRDLLRKWPKVVSLRASDYVTLHRLLLQHGVFDIPSTEMKKMHYFNIEKYFDHPAVHHHCPMEFERIRFYTMQIEAFERIILNSVEVDPSDELLKTIP